jgi:hypothetical protein
MSKLSDVTKDGYKRVFKREEIKAALMQMSYGQREKGTKEQLKKDLRTEYSDEIYQIYMLAVNKVLPGFLDIMNQVNEFWDGRWDSVSWTMPDGFVVTCKPISSGYIDFEIDDRIINAKVTGVEKVSSALILYVNIIHSVDAYAMRRIIENADYDIITIHDATRCLANHSKETRKAYANMLAEINDSNLLEDILSEITGQEITIDSGSLKSEDILKAKYALC